MPGTSRARPGDRPCIPYVGHGAAAAARPQPGSEPTVCVCFFVLWAPKVARSKCNSSL